MDYKPSDLFLLSVPFVWVFRNVNIPTVWIVLVAVTIAIHHAYTIRQMQPTVTL
jgi:hypothetical protein